MKHPMFNPRIAFAACAFLLCLSAIELPAAKQPNLVIILTDDQGYADVGFNGSPDIRTPHIDTLAGNGVRFTNAYVTHPVCGPSRAGLLTGRYQGRFGFNTNPSVDPNNPNVGIPHDESTIGEVLQTANYTSAVIGKWHMGSHSDHHPLNRGFDYFYGFLSGGHDFFPENLVVPDLHHVTRQWEWYRTKIMEDFERIDTDDYLTDELSDAATAFIRKAAAGDQPFCVYLAYNAPHTPLQATDTYLDRFPDIKDPDRRTYAAMLSAVDDGVGRVLSTLRELGIEDDTILFFLSDNGGASNNASINKPLRGFKSSYFEGGIRVPFVMQWTGTVPGGVDYEHPVSALDILGTIAGQSGAAIAPDRPLDGVDLVPYVTGAIAGPPHEKLFWRNPDSGSMAIRMGDLKLVANRNRSRGNYALFNLADDLRESKNLRNGAPEKVEALKSTWEAWNSQLKEQAFPTLGNDKWWRR
jgi:arylsulfatase A-like enzyme